MNARRALAAGLLVLALLGCAGPAALLLGEQHDAASHAGAAHGTVARLAAEDRLAALVLEMAERGRDTAGLARDAGEPEVRERLHWNEAAWPWARYGPVVMAAVRAGVVVRGANLPRADMAAAQRDASLDGLLGAEALQRQRAAIRDGHCGLLPEAQVPGMARIQIARDRSMAQVVASAAVPGRVVVLLAGSEHVAPGRGVPVHLPAGLVTRSDVLPVAAADASGRDHCAELRRQWGR